MISVKDKDSIYLKNKMGDMIRRFTDENINRYIDFYDSFPESLRSILSLLHYELNRLFKYMNDRISNGHYTADESRDLIYLSEEIKTIQSNLRGSEYDYDLISYYKEKLIECDSFLQSSNGSPIPRDFNKIILVENEPIFSLQSSISIPRSKKKVLFPTKTIGNGSYASVHKYKDEYYNRTFVVKKAFKNLTEKEYERFRIEFEEMKKLNSPYVIEVYNYDDENYQYIMEYADETLDSYIAKNNGKLLVRERIGLVNQILKAFIYINSKGVLHRDISTKNVLLKKYDGLNIIKISDFGLVKRRDSTLTSQNTEFKGSLNDPKLEIIGFNNYEIRHETYALTRLIYFVMTGKLRIDSFRSKEFEKFIMKGIADNINERYMDVEELRRSFQSVINGLN